MKSSILTASPNAKYDVNRDSIPARRAMSKILRPIQLIPAAFVLILQFFTFAAGQGLDGTLKIAAGDRPSVGVKMKLGAIRDVKNLWFLDEYAGVTGLLTKRFSSIDFRDKQGFLIARRYLTGFDSFSTGNVGSVNYVVDLKPLPGAFAAAHTSWINGDRGILMLDDLRPQGTERRAKIKLELPVGWIAHSPEPQISPDVFEVQDVERSVFFIGQNLRELKSKRLPILKLSLSGQWHFSDEEATVFAESILGEYESKFGSLGKAAVQVGIGKFPENLVPGSWEADTRGRTVTIMSSDMPYKSQSLQRLHEQLRHEVFHLWIPNGVNLTGNYDWFYEGFALYQSLKMGVAVNRIRFDDYLETLSRAYAIDARQSNKTSMIESSRNRWNGSNTDVYARGMLVAFLCDVAMLDASKGKRSTTDLLREVYWKHGGSAKPEDGNAAILTLMKRYPELTPIAGRYVTGAEKLEWAELIKAAGFDADAKSGRLSVSAKPSGRQKDLLDKLGYNNWRKLANEKR